MLLELESNNGVILHLGWAWWKLIGVIRIYLTFVLGRHWYWIMAAAAYSGSNSLKEYLKRYGINDEEDKKKKKKKKKKVQSKPDATSLLVVDEDPVWQKTVNLEEENSGDSAGK